MGLKNIGESLPPGFRFYPSDDELVCHYLQKKIDNEETHKGTLVEVDLHTCEPWQLPEVAKLNGNEWYFFSFHDRKYATGFRTNRATTSGYWKATGKDRVILDPKTRMTVGTRKTLVFYRNRAPNGIKTAWIMHEFRLESPCMPPKEDWVLCRVFHKISSGENTTNNDNDQPYDNILDHHHHPVLINGTGTSSPPLITRHHQIEYQLPPNAMPCGNYHQAAAANYSFSSNTAYSTTQMSHIPVNQNQEASVDVGLSSTAGDHRFVHYLKDQTHSNSTSINIKHKGSASADDEAECCEFLWDVNNLLDCSWGQ